MQACSRVHGEPVCVARPAALQLGTCGGGVLDDEGAPRGDEHAIRDPGERGDVVGPQQTERHGHDDVLPDCPQRALRGRRQVDQSRRLGPEGLCELADVPDGFVAAGSLHELVGERDESWDGSGERHLPAPTGASGQDDAATRSGRDHPEVERLAHDVATPVVEGEEEAATEVGEVGVGAERGVEGSGHGTQVTVPGAVET